MGRLSKLIWLRAIHVGRGGNAHTNRYRTGPGERGKHADAVLEKNGSFSRRLVDGEGVCAALREERDRGGHGRRVIDDVPEMIKTEPRDILPRLDGCDLPEDVSV